MWVVSWDTEAFTIKGVVTSVSPKHAKAFNKPLEFLEMEEEDLLQTYAYKTALIVVSHRPQLTCHRCEQVYIEWIDKKILLYSAGNSTQYPVINHVGKEY